MATSRSVAIQREATLARIAESVEDLGGGGIVPKSGSKGDPELKQLIAIADALESIPAAEVDPEIAELWDRIDVAISISEKSEDPAVEVTDAYRLESILSVLEGDSETKPEVKTSKKDKETKSKAK